MAARKTGSSYSSGCITNKNVIQNANSRFSGLFNSTESNSDTSNVGNNMAGLKTKSSFNSGCVADGNATPNTSYRFARSLNSLEASSNISDFGRQLIQHGDRLNRKCF
jgi:hypothetical protein